MSALKNKLSQKVDVINEHFGTENNQANAVMEQQNNVIVLKNADVDTNCSIVPSFAITLNDAKERILMLQSFVKEMMIPNVDYGLIPRCDKPSLFKSGAEKLCDIFGFSKQIEILNRIEDWDKGLFHYEVKLILTNKRTGIIEAEGVGACNSRERKFKTQDSYSIINTLLKMAKKRALIDAVLSATRSSGIFTQDIEDLDFEEPSPKYKENKTESTKGNMQQTPSNRAATPTSPKPINKAQQTKLLNIINQRRLPIDDMKLLMKERYNVTESKNLSSDQANDFIEFLSSYNII